MSVLESVRRPRVQRISQARRALPTGVDLRVWVASSELTLKRGVKAAKRKVWPGAPSFGLLVGGAIFAVGVLAFVTYVLGWHLGSWSDRVCHANEVRCALVTHVLGTGLVVVLVYFLWFLRRETRAAAKWRREARNAPETLMDWVSPSGGLTGLAARATGVSDHHPTQSMRPAASAGRLRSAPSSLLDSAVPRKRLVAEIAAELNDDLGPQIVVGDTGSGKTMFLLELCRYLAEHGQVPVPLTLRGAKKIDLAAQARAAYIRLAKAKDEEEANKQWAWLKERKLITILADDLEQSSTAPQERFSALARASQLKLRVVVATRPHGLPHSHRRERQVGGRVDIPELDPDSLCADLTRRALEAAAAGHHDPPADTPEVDAKLGEGIANLVDKVGMGTTPYYLALARVLVRIDALDEVRTDGDAQLGLIHTYRLAFENGRITPDDGLTIETRIAVFKRLEAIAYFRLLGTSGSQELREKLRGLDFGPPDTVLLDSPLDLARRMGVIEDGHKEEAWFVHPTTMAYFAAEFLGKQAKDSVYWQDAISACRTSGSPLLMLALRFASSVTLRDQHASPAAETVKAVCARIKDANGRPDEPPSTNLKWCATAADIVRLQRGALPQPDRTEAEVPSEREVHDELVSEVVTAARSLVTVPGRLTVEKRALIRAVASLDAHAALWESATSPHQEYVVRREAIRQLLANRTTAEQAFAFMCGEADDAIKAIQERVEASAPHHDDKGDPLFDAFRAVAWILPSLHTKAVQADLNFDHSPQELHALGRRLSVQLGLESSIAQGMKLDAMANPDAPVDEFALTMLTATDDHLRAQFWFTRVLLLQAVTRRRLAGEAPTAADPIVKLIDAAAHDESEHPFVHETARLCAVALRKGEWERYIWSDMTEVAAGAPHCLVVEATQLIGDIIILLNLNNRRSAEGRRTFGADHRLPHCVQRSEDRAELLGLHDPHEGCPFRDERPSHPLVTSTPETRDGHHRCLCPYLYEPQEDELEARRELSRAFCRHQRITARPLRWAPEIDTESLREFWIGMETRARF